MFARAAVDRQDAFPLRVASQNAWARPARRLRGIPVIQLATLAILIAIFALEVAWLADG